MFFIAFAAARKRTYIAARPAPQLAGSLSPPKSIVQSRSGASATMRCISSGAIARSAAAILNARGASVPEPVSRSHEALLMEYFGDAQGAAPPLQRISLGRGDAEEASDASWRP